jgi:hypothetical protein
VVTCRGRGRSLGVCHDPLTVVRGSYGWGGGRRGGFVGSMLCGMVEPGRERQRRYVDPLDLRERRHERPERTVSPVVLVAGPVIAVAWLAALAAVVGWIGGPVLTMAVLLAGPSLLAGLLLVTTEAQGSGLRIAGWGLLASGGALTMLVVLGA